MGAPVLLGNYDIFAHILQRLHLQPWTDPPFAKHLIDSQILLHGHVWGLGDDGWLASLGAEDRELAIDALAANHFAIRLAIDISGCAANARLDGTASIEESQRRAALRDCARAILAHPGWEELVVRQPNFALATSRLAATLASDAQWAYWPTAPSYRSVIDAIEELAQFRTPAEFEREVLDLVGGRASVAVSEVLLGPEERQLRTHDLHVSGLPAALDRDAALSLMSRLVTYRPGNSYRVHDGTARLLLRPSGEVVWSPSPGRTEYLDRVPAPAGPVAAAIDRLRHLGTTSAAEVA